MAQPAWTERNLDLPGGVRVHVYEAGPAGGAPVVLLHGGGIDSTRLSWGPTLEVLAREGFRVVAPDCPGHGGSPPLPGRFTLARWTELLPAVFDSAGLPRAAVVGVSLGGGAGLGLALSAPSRVERLCLVGSYGLQRQAPYHHLSWLLVRLPGVAPLMGAMLGASRAALKSNLRGIVRNPAALTEELIDQVAEAARHPTALRVFSDFQRDEIRWRGLHTHFVERLGELRMPVLLVHGENDIGVPVADARAAAARLPNARLEVFAGAGHWTQRDEPERFHALLRAFLRGEPSVQQAGVG